MRGKLVTWKAEKAFGFIRPDEGGKDVFVHLRDFGEIPRAPRVGDVVQFQRVQDGAGRYRAADVAVSGLPRKSAAKNRPAGGTPPSGEVHVAAWRWFVVLAFAAVLVALVLKTPLPLIVPPVYVVASLVAVMLYAFDKAAAMNGRWRTTESTLLIAGLLGGWPGALIAQGMFRHKSRKVEFLAPFWISVALNCALLAWASSGKGAAAIRGLLY
jgi:uncharacterized membrane protein YsdA (DUF1294 family)/cold shock CspA family protein